MLSHEKLDLYVQYKGSWENWLRSPDGTRSLKEGKPDLLQDEDWASIAQSLHDLYLIDNGLVAASFAEQLESTLSALCEDSTVVQRLKDLVPYCYGLWDKKNSPAGRIKQFINRALRLFS